MDSSDTATVGLLEVDVSELVSRVGDEDGSEPILDVLKIGSCPEI
jgi:hypothetical protein